MGAGGAVEMANTGECWLATIINPEESGVSKEVMRRHLCREFLDFGKGQASSVIKSRLLRSPARPTAVVDRLVILRRSKCKKPRYRGLVRQSRPLSSTAISFFTQRPASADYAYALVM
jgi:hypothetical protein